MAVPTLGTAPVLSTPEDRVLEEQAPAVDVARLPRLSDDQLALVYEVERTVSEIRAGRWRRIALQFPDHMLVDAPRVFNELGRRLKQARTADANATLPGLATPGESVEAISQGLQDAKLAPPSQVDEEKVYILGDTSYGACCVDEVAAEHINADVIVHYGRACLSPTARLPVIYVFTFRPLDLDPVVASFRATYPDKDQKVILMADIPYATYIKPLHERLSSEGYHVFSTEIAHNPSSPIPNRTVPTDVIHDKTALREYQLFHLAEPPTSLLLTLSSRVGAIHIYPIDGSGSEAVQSLPVSSARALQRRYALLTSLSTAPIFGILVNTLSVKNYMHILAHVKEQIAAAGKKSYTFVVGKINAAKIANFSEVGGWVVIGCWESSLVESKEFWKPIITPFELGLALQSDAERVWTGEWTSDFQAILAARAAEGEEDEGRRNGHGGDRAAVDAVDADAGADADADVEPAPAEGESDDDDDDEESAPPEFDLRTGRYVSHSRPMRAGRRTGSQQKQQQQQQRPQAANALIKRANGELAQVGGVVSPGAEFLRSQRTWQGLGSDFAAADGSVAHVEEGRRGIASAYAVGDGTQR